MIVLGSLWPLLRLAALVGVRRKGAQRLAVDLDPGASVSPVLAAVEEVGVEVESARVTEEADLRQVEIVVSGKQEEVGMLLDVAARVEGVRSASWAT